MITKIEQQQRDGTWLILGQASAKHRITIDCGLQINLRQTERATIELSFGGIGRDMVVNLNSIQYGSDWPKSLVMEIQSSYAVPMALAEED